MVRNNKFILVHSKFLLSRYFTFSIKRRASTMNRTCVPSPIVPFLSQAATLNVSLRPSMAVRVAVALTSCPIALGRVCRMFIAPPTVVLPSGREGATACIAAFSISATSDGVANTGSAPDPT